MVPTLVYYTGGSWVSLKTTQPGVTDIDFINLNTKSRKLIKVIDILGRETNVLKNTILFYMYDDGTIEKNISQNNLILLYYGKKIKEDNF